MTNMYNPLLLIMYISRNVNGCLNIDGFFLPFKLLNDFYDLKKSHVHKEKNCCSGVITASSGSC